MVPEHIITAHQAFIERRRELRPFGEDRIAEPDEWAEFEQRLSEAKPKAWLGEVAVLQESLKHLRLRRAEAQRRLELGENAFADDKRQ
ncbi:MAG: hypothetical protein ACR2LX_12830 [Jatrophihabitans sp.]